MKLKLLFVVVLFIALAAAVCRGRQPQSTLSVQGPAVPQSTMPERKWPSPLPYPDGAEKFTGTAWTQSIFVLNDRDVIEQVPRKNLEAKWRVSGGMVGVDAALFRSDKYRTLPKESKNWIGNIGVLNSFGYTQQNRGLKRDYPDGTRFDDVLSNKDGACFEHRVREKKDGRWTSRVAFSDKASRPTGYAGLTVTCASCHDQAGSGGYAVGMVPGGDTVISDPLAWSLIGR